MGAPYEPASLVTTLGGDRFNRADGQTDSPVAPRPNPIALLNFVNWQPVRPGYARFRRPEGSEKVIVPRAGGRGCPRARTCRPCKSVTFSYAADQLD